MKATRLTLPSRQRGAAIFVAIFLITVVVLAAAIVALTSVTQHTGQARAGQAEQAWYAALARMETEVGGIISTNSCPPSQAQTLFGLDTRFSCDRTEVSEGAVTYGIYSLEASATLGSPDAAIFVRRSVRAQVVDGPS